MSAEISAVVSGSVWRAIESRREETGETTSQIVDALLSEALDLERHTIFQVSTSNALVEGVFSGVATVGQLKRHGDFGLGTFTDLDGEMIMIDGECFRATAGGAVNRVEDGWQTPFALVTRFQVDETAEIDAETDFERFSRDLDSMRPSENLFVAIRAEATFDTVTMRAACRALSGEGLVEATGHQSEFEYEGVTGSLVGFWAPEYSRSVSVPGYHFHFISADRSIGGHVLGLRTPRIALQMHTETGLHLALPETEEFLSADLSGDHLGELRVAETERRT